MPETESLDWRADVRRNLSTGVPFVGIGIVLTAIGIGVHGQFVLVAFGLVCLSLGTILLVRSRRARGKPRLEYGFRGEDISYALDGRTAWLGFTWCDGPRIYPDSLKKWQGTQEDLASYQKAAILRAAIAFVAQDREKPVVVVNRDDPDRDLWEGVIGSEGSLIKSVEYTSNAQETEFQKKIFLDTLRAGKQLTINGREIKSEQDIDAFLRGEP